MADSYPTSPSKPRRGTARGASSSYGGGSSGIVEGKRNRGGKKNYVVDSTEDDDEEDGDEDLDAEGDEDDDLGDEDADGEADADGDIDMVIPTPALKKAAQPPKGILKSSAPLDDDDEDDELSDTNLDATNYGYDSLEEDAEGEEDDDMEVVAPSRVKSGRNDDDDDEDLDSDDEMASRGETPDLSRMTKRQRARFEDDDDGAFMKLSNEVQTKKHFTAEELSMRRTELARRRRNLSEKRNEEVKMETVNKLLKKQPPKTNKKAKTLEEELAEQAARRPNPTLVRWVSTKTGETLSVPDEILESPINVAFMDTMKPQPRTKLIEEVATSAEALEALALCAAAKCLGLEPDIDVLLDSGAPPPLTRRRCKLHWDILEETLEDPPDAACAEEWRNFVYRAVAHIVNLPDWALWALPPSDTPLSIPSPSVRASAAHVSGAVSPLAQRDADGCPPTGGHAYAEAMSLPLPAPAADVPMLDVGMDVEMDMMMEAISDIDEDEDDALIEWVPEEEWPRTHTAEDHKFLEMLASCPTVLYPESWDGDDMQEHTMALVESPPGASLEPKTPDQMAHWSPCLRGVGLADAWSFSGGQLL